MRYIVGFFVIIFLIILIIVLLVSGGGGGPNPKVKPQLTSYAKTITDLRLTIDGSVSAPQTHRQVQITVANNQSTIQVFKGYQDQVLKSKSYDNDITSYGVFLRALDLAGYSKGNDSSKLADERGVCPLGQRYIFEIISAGQDVQRYWSTSCGGGTYGGKTQLTLTLFEKQIPDYDNLAGDVNL